MDTSDPSHVGFQQWITFRKTKKKRIKKIYKNVLLFILLYPLLHFNCKLLQQPFTLIYELTN